MALSAARPVEWLSAGQVDDLSDRLHDPTEVRQRRKAAFQSFLDQPMEPDPLYRKYGYFAGVDLAGIAPGATGAAVPSPSVHDESLLVIHDAAGTHVTVPAALERAGVTVTALPEILQDPTVAAEFLGPFEPAGDRLTGLAEAIVNRGVRIELPDRLERPIRLRDVTVLSTPHEAIAVRRVIRAGRGTRLLATEEQYSHGAVPEAQRLTTSSTSLELGDGALAAYLTLQAADTRAISVYQRHAHLAAHARLGWVWAGFGGFRTRIRNRTVLAGNGSDLEDLQAFYGAGQQAYDSGIRIEHVGTDTRGQSITRGVFRDESRGMSRGLVRIEKEARKTVSFLSEHAMLLSRGARSDTVPILEILCRDVKATHSTSVAPVDPEKVFYLESRGIESSSAIRMIGEGFLSHVLDRAPIAGLRDALYPFLAARWEGRTFDWDAGRGAPVGALEFGGPMADPEWRFDAKLR